MDSQGTTLPIGDLLAQTGGLTSMANELGVSEEEARSGAAALAPAILGGFKNAARTEPGGLEGLGGLLAKLGGGGLLDNVLAPQSTDTGRGNNVLGQIFGSKDTSRAVADHAASRTGLQPSLLKRMLPMVAMMVAGYMAKQGRGGGLTGGLGNRVPGMAASGLGALLDMDRDGNPLDDILRMAARRR
jgi:hypothetical protein